MIPVVFVRGRSGSGKTTLIVCLIRWFRGRGFKVGAVKHAHDVDEFDHPGKDSHKMRVEGASQVLVAGKSQAAVFFPVDSGWNETTIASRFSGVDLILVEGFRTVRGEIVVTVDGGDIVTSDGSRFDRDDVSGLGGWIVMMTGLGRRDEGRDG